MGCLFPFSKNLLTLHLQYVMLYGIPQALIDENETAIQMLEILLIYGLAQYTYLAAAHRYIFTCV